MLFQWQKGQFGMKTSQGFQSSIILYELSCNIQN